MHNTALLPDSGNFNTRVRGFQEVIRSSSFAGHLISLTCFAIFEDSGLQEKLNSALSPHLSSNTSMYLVSV
jgi:hypothetical protein